MVALRRGDAAVVGVVGDEGIGRVRELERWSW